MIEAFITVGILRSLCYGQHCGKLHRYQWCVFHFVFWSSRMHTSTCNRDCCGGCVKGLILDLSELTAIDGICKICSETLNIEQVSSSSYFFVGSKADFDCSVCNLRVFQKVIRHCHNRCDSCFVVTTQQSQPVRYNQVIPLILLEHRKFRRG
jgi:hypothetical protein